MTRGIRRLLWSLVLVLAALQYGLWFGRGGRLDVQEVRDQIAAQSASNAEFAARNRGLAAEVMDLKEGLDAIEELARSEMGMVRQNEIFFQMIEPATPVSEKAIP